MYSLVWKGTLVASFLGALLFAGVFPVADSGYDVVILNGRVMDVETNFDAVRNVGIRDGKIAVITEKPISGKETIDATGHIVTAGFIDTHFHWTRPMGYKLGLRDGVTSAMDLEFGTLGSYVDQWYKDREGKTQLNYGTAPRNDLARSLVLDNAKAHDAPEGQKSRGVGMNWALKKPNLEEGNRILQNLDEGLRAGAIGIGSTVGYMRDGSSVREMFEVQRVAANYGRQISVHLRYTPGDSTTEVVGAQEILANALALGAPAGINHFNNPGWQMTHELLVRLRARGFNVWGEIYPYAAGSTTINAVFLKPQVWVDQLGHKYEDTLMDPVTNTFYTQEKYEQVLKKDPSTIVILYKMPESDIVKWLRLPGETMASDGMPIPGDWAWDTPYDKLPNMHPRGAGSRGLSLRLARENKIAWTQILAMLSYNSAKYLGSMGLESMKARGRMQQGMVADIVIFDPDKVTDHATYEHGTLPTTGIPYVLVNGVIVVKDSQVLPGAFPGRPLRFTPEEKGRFKPLSAAEWEERYMAPAVDFGGLSKLPGKGTGH
jgi:hypothetical protein